MEPSRVLKLLIFASLTLNLNASPITDLLVVPSNLPSSLLSPSAPPPSNSPLPMNTANWSFLVYQNGRCTGESDKYSGSGSLGCQTGVFLNGGIQGFQKVFLGNGRCSVSFYADEGCTDQSGQITPSDGRSCHKVSGSGNAVAYDVSCI